MKKRRILYLFISACLAILLCFTMIACDGDEEDPEDTEEIEDEEAEDEEETEGKKTNKVDKDTEDEKSDDEDEDAEDTDNEAEESEEDTEPDEDTDDADIEDTDPEATEDEGNEDTDPEATEDEGSNETDPEETTPAAKPGSGTINVPSGSLIPTPGTGADDPTVEGDPAVNKMDTEKYDLAKFTYPIWNTDISYAETVFVTEYTSNYNMVYQLLYPATEVISVRDSTLQKLYVEGVDYVVENGNIKVLKTGSIKILPYSQYHYDISSINDAHYDMNNNSKAFYYGETSSVSSPGMSQYCIAVTYKHTANSIVSVPTAKTNKFQKLITKLNNKEDITMVSIGDSITERWSSSASAGLLPGCPSHSNLLASYIREAYGVNVVNNNIAYSGKTTDWALNYCNDRKYVPVEKIATFNPDLVIVAFGMNDAGGKTPANFLTNINNILNQLKTSCPNAEVLVVGTALPNPQMCWKGGTSAFLNYHDDYSATLLEAEKNWTNAAYADVTKAHIEMLKTNGGNPNLNNGQALTGRKTYQDTSGSNSNHPNDYFIRVYAQVEIQTMFGEFKLKPAKTA